MGINDAFTRALIDRAGASGIHIDLATGPQDGPFVIRPAVPFLEGGFYTGFVNEKSQVDMDLRITMPDGRILDEISLAHSTQPSLMNPSSGGRLREDGAALGNIVARYIASRVGAQ